MLIAEKLRERAAYLSDTLLAICGFDARENSRRREPVIARAMVSHVLRNEGWTESQVAGVMGRTHATINYYSKVMASIMTVRGYDAERELWNKFKKKLGSG